MTNKTTKTDTKKKPTFRHEKNLYISTDATFATENSTKRLKVVQNTELAL